MKDVLCYSLLLGVLAFSGCVQQLPPSEVDLRGAWRQVRPKEQPANDIRFGKLGDQLLLDTYHQQYRASLNQDGDTLDLRYGCLGLAAPLTFYRGADRRTDILVIEGFGSFSRMSWEVLAKQRRAYFVQVRADQAAFDMDSALRALQRMTSSRSQ